jgi:hypothetical protein
MPSYREYVTLPNYCHHVFRDGIPLWSKGPRWSNVAPPPSIGATVFVIFNRIGLATVTGYFKEAGLLGLVVSLTHGGIFRVFGEDIQIL